jgi:phospholipase/carboxylesterase
MSEQNAIIIETGDKTNINAAVIWLHGLGADANDFVPIIPELHLPAGLNIRFIFPNAPIQPVTINQGYRMPAWYDIRSVSIVDDDDRAGIEESSQNLALLCQQQIDNGITSRRIVLAGFSQGGAIALHCGCRFKQPLGGIMALSTYMPLPDQLEPEISLHATTTPVFMAHGRQDDVVAIEHARRSSALLQSLGIAVEWHDYDMPHSVNAEEITDISQWLIRVIS